MFDSAWRRPAPSCGKSCPKGEGGGCPDRDLDHSSAGLGARNKGVWALDEAHLASDMPEARMGEMSMESNGISGRFVRTRRRLDGLSSCMIHAFGDLQDLHIVNFRGIAVPCVLPG